MMRVLVFLIALCISVPAMAQLNAHFGDMDTNKDGKVSASEFATSFQNSTPADFKQADADNSGGIDHDEWHAYKEKHGLGHVDGASHDTAKDPAAKK